MSETASAASRALVDRAADWLMAQALKDADLETVVRGCCERLHAAGVPIARAQLSFSMLHPLYRAIGFTWRRGQGLQVDAYRHTPGNTTPPDRWLKSPYYHLKRHSLDHLRRRLDMGGAAEFPIFDDLRQEGLTDYLAFTSSFELDKGQGMLGSWATDQRGGFADDEIAALLAIQDSLAVACKMALRGGLAKSALSTYLGAKAGERVLSGQIKRGDGETTRAAIVWGDLRNSTGMAEIGRQAYIDNINAFFDATAGAVADAGGEILSFVGDGFLAVFPCGRNQKDSSEACKLALSAALEATHRMAETNRQRAAAGEPVLGYGLGLHIGNVMFGNVGLAERLAFSVFGAAVNEVARLETLTKKFATPIVASEEFTGYCGGDWAALGRESLRGVNAPIAVFRPATVDRQPEAPIIKRSRVRDLSDAEAVILLYRDSPAEGQIDRM
jgi:adenylate cyclase